MKNKFLENLHKFYGKIKGNKKIQIMLLIALILVILICFFAFSNNTKPKEESIQETNTSSYVADLENKLKNSLIKIDGVDDVSVMITLENGFEYVYATEEETKQTASGTLKTTSLVLVSGQPIVVKEIYPTIKGVVVITPAAKNINIRLNILSAIQTVLEVTNDKITILN